MQSESNVRVVDIAAISDYRFYQQYEGNTTASIQQAINDTNRYLKNSGIPLAFRLNETMIFKDPSEANQTFTYTETSSGEIDPEDLLASVDSFVLDNATLSPYEDVQLFTGFDMEGSTFGIAYTGVNDKSLTIYPREDVHKGIGVVQGTIPLGGVNGIIAAHELGHSFSAGHDGVDNSCPSEGYIMTVQLEDPLPTSYSDCSVSAIQNHLNDYFDNFIDDDFPSLHTDNSTSLSSSGNATLNLSYVATDSHLRKYTVLVDGQYYTAGRLDGNSDSFSFEFVPKMGGVYNITVIVEDYAYKTDVVTTQIQIIDTDAPEISKIEDLTIDEGTDESVSWNITDFELDQAVLYVNNTIEKEIELEGDSAVVKFPLANLTAGIYNFTLVVKDHSNNTSTDTVWIEIQEQILPNGNLTDRFSLSPPLYFLAIAGLTFTILLKKLTYSDEIVK